MAALRRLLRALSLNGLFAFHDISAVENFSGGLKTEAVRYKLSVVREFKMEIPARSLSEYSSPSC
jgi:hypothetical protein